MKFKVYDLLSVASGILCGKMDGVYEVCNFITGDNLFTHQLPRAFDYCSPIIYAKHPQLKDANVQGISGDTLADKIEQWESMFGKELDIEASPEGWQHKDPLTELAEKVGQDKVIVVQVE